MSSTPTPLEQLSKKYVDFKDFSNEITTDGLIAVKSSTSKWGLFDLHQGKLVAKLLYTSIRPTRKKSRLYLELQCGEFRGLFHIPSRRVILGAARYYSILEISEELFHLVDQHKRCFIFRVNDHAVIGDDGYASIEWAEDHIAVYKNGKQGWLDRQTAEEIVPLRYVSIIPLASGWFTVLSEFGKPGRLFHPQQGEIS